MTDWKPIDEIRARRRSKSAFGRFLPEERKAIADFYRSTKTPVKEIAARLRCSNEIVRSMIHAAGFELFKAEPKPVKHKPGILEHHAAWKRNQGVSK